MTTASGGGLTDVLSWMKNGVAALNLIATNISKGFPQQTGTATTASAGTAGAPPAQVAGYISVTVNGSAVNVPYYNP